jgi:hypothetical protein
MRTAQYAAGARDAGNTVVERGRNGRPRYPFRGSRDVGLRASHYRRGLVQLGPVGRDHAPAFGRDPIARRLARRAGAPAMSTALPAPPERTAAAPSVGADRLRHALDMALHVHPKHPAIRPRLGVAPLPFGGLFLVRGEGEREWALEGRTWTSPSAAAVRQAELEAILAARRLDPSVAYPLPPRRRPAAPRPPRAPRWYRHHARRKTSGALR